MEVLIDVCINSNIISSSSSGIVASEVERAGIMFFEERSMRKPCAGIFSFLGPLYVWYQIWLSPAQDVQNGYVTEK